MRVFRSPALWLTFLAAAIYALLAVPYWKPTWDSATYITLARALVRGEGYTYMGFPHTKYPPGFPLLLTPSFAFFGGSLWWMRGLLVACAAGSVGMSYLLLRRFVSSWVAVCLCAMTAASYALFFEATRILSDLPYMLFSLAALYFGERSRMTWRNTVIVIALVLASYLTRIIGFTLAFALAGAILLNRSSGLFPKRLLHAGVLLGIMALTAALWMGRNAAVPEQMPSEFRESLSYENELFSVNPSDPYAPKPGIGEWTQRIATNIGYYERLLASLLTGQKEKNPTVIHLLSLLWLVGWLLAANRYRSSVEWYTFAYLWVYLLWPSQQEERFLVPILPMLFYYVLVPILYALEWNRCFTGQFVHGGMRTLIVGGLAAAVVAFNAPLDAERIRDERKTPYYSEMQANYLASMVWIRNMTPPNAIVITDRAPYVWYIAERVAYSGPWIEDKEKVLEAWERHGVTHVIVNDIPNAEKYINPVVAEYPDHFHEVARFGKNVVYEKKESEVRSQKGVLHGDLQHHQVLRPTSRDAGRGDLHQLPLSRSATPLFLPLECPGGERHSRSRNRRPSPSDGTLSRLRSART